MNGLLYLLLPDPWSARSPALMLGLARDSCLQPAERRVGSRHLKLAWAGRQSVAVLRVTSSGDELSMVQYTTCALRHRPRPWLPRNVIDTLARCCKGASNYGAFEFKENDRNWANISFTTSALAGSQFRQEDAAQLMNVCGCSVEEARKLLIESGNNLETACDRFFTGNAT